MKEKTLLKISLVITILGIIMLFFISKTLDINENIISADNIDKEIKVTGLVTKVTETDKVTFLEISKPEKVTACVFDKVDIKVDDKVTVEGELEEYNGKLELIARRISK